MTLDEEKRILNAKRISAVREAWRNEKLLVEQGKGSRQWSQSEIAELKSKGYVSGYYGHHMQSVKIKPNQAINPDNIQFLTREEHINGAHGGSTHNLTNGYYDVRTKTMHNFKENERPHKPIYTLDNSISSKQSHTNEKSISKKSSNNITH